MTLSHAIPVNGCDVYDSWDLCESEGQGQLTPHINNHSRMRAIVASLADWYVERLTMLQSCKKVIRVAETLSVNGLLVCIYCHSISTTISLANLWCLLYFLQQCPFICIHQNLILKIGQYARLVVSGITPFNYNATINVRSLDMESNWLQFGLWFTPNKMMSIIDEKYSVGLFISVYDCTCQG